MRIKWAWSGFIGTSVITLTSALLGTPPAAEAARTGDPFACRAQTSVFSVEGSPRLREALELEPPKKLSRDEFGDLPMMPASSEVLPAGTELNVLVDTECLKDPARGPLEIEWLRQLRDKILNRHYRSPLQSFAWRLEQDWDFIRLQDTLERETCIDLVSPEGRFETTEHFSDPFLKNQSHLRTIGFEETIDSFLLPLLLRPKITIAVIDTGVDLNHPDLRPNRWINKEEKPGNGIDDDRNGFVDDVNGYNFATDTGDARPGPLPTHRHGSHVAGLAAARIDNGNGGVGINGIAKVMSLNVFGPGVDTRSSIVENAIRYAADQGAEIINLSLGGGQYSRTMRSALTYAISRGSFIVAAAGNTGIELCDNPLSFGFRSPGSYGAALDGMLTIGSIDTLDGRLSGFSNYSPRLIELTAPGAVLSRGKRLGLLSSSPRGGYVLMDGTSMSAPIVSGTAALAIAWLRAYRYDASPQELERILKEAAHPSPHLLEFVQGGRTLDLRTLLEYLRIHFPERFL